MLIHFADTYHYTGPEGHPFQVSSEHVFLVLEIVHDSVNLVPVTQWGCNQAVGLVHTMQCNSAHVSIWCGPCDVTFNVIVCSCFI